MAGCPVRAVRVNAGAGPDESPATAAAAVVAWKTYGISLNFVATIAARAQRLNNPAMVCAMGFSSMPVQAI